MPVLIALPMYPVSEVCEKLAARKERDKPYDRQQVNAWIKKHKLPIQKIGNHYMFTDIEIEWLATKIRVNKTRQKKIDE